MNRYDNSPNAPRPAATQPRPRRANPVTLGARALIEDLGRGMRPGEIRARYGWSRSAYQRRLARVESLSREEQYNPDHPMIPALACEARYRQLQRDADTSASGIRQQLLTLGGSAGEAQLKAGLTNALIGLMRFIADCEQKIFRAAEKAKILPACEPKKRLTFSDYVKFMQEFFKQNPDMACCLPPVRPLSERATETSQDEPGTAPSAPPQSDSAPAPAQDPPPPHKMAEQDGTPQHANDANARRLERLHRWWYGGGNAEHAPEHQPANDTQGRAPSGVTCERDRPEQIGANRNISEQTGTNRSTAPERVEPR